MRAMVSNLRGLRSESGILIWNCGLEFAHHIRQREGIQKAGIEQGLVRGRN